jgi:hypothetical protein
LARGKVRNARPYAAQNPDWNEAEMHLDRAMNAISRLLKAESAAARAEQMPA